MMNPNPQLIPLVGLLADVLEAAATEAAERAVRKVQAAEAEQRLPATKAAKRLGVHPDTLRKWRDRDVALIAKGKPILGPPWIQVGGRYEYVIADLDEWVARGRAA
jgi:hypothetical protein